MIQLKGQRSQSKKTINNYKNLGWNILNKVEAGCIGGNTQKWTKEKCIIDAKLYHSKLEWSKGSPSAYSSCNKNKWIDECCEHMILTRKSNNYWTKEQCIKSAKKYNSKSEWGKNDKRAYFLCLKNKWINECCNHMIRPTNKKRKEIIQFSKNGDKINEFISLTEAGRKTDINNSHISQCCLGKRKSAGGFIWKYKDQEE